MHDYRMCDEDSKDVPEMLFVQDQQPVETFCANSAYERSATPFACGARNGVRMISHSALRNTSSKPVGELLVPIADHAAERFWAVGQAPGQLSGLLCHPLCGRSRRAASDMHAPAAQLDEEEYVEPLEPHGLHSEEVNGEQASPVQSQKLAPSHPATRTGWSETCAPKPGPHRRG
jgi:hypothetical protein